MGKKMEKKSSIIKSTHYSTTEHLLSQEKEKSANTLIKDFILKDDSVKQRGFFTEETEARESKHVSFRRPKPDKRNSGLKPKPKIERDFSRSPQNSINSWNLESIKEEKQCSVSSPLIQRPLNLEQNFLKFSDKSERIQEFNNFEYPIETEDLCGLSKKDLQEHILRDNMILSEEKSFEEKSVNEGEIHFERNIKKEEYQDGVLNLGKLGENENFFPVDDESN